MKLLQKLRIWKELKRLEARVHESPSPSTYVDLGQVYINLGMHEKTLEIAEEALALFPNSEELRKLRKFARKARSTSRIKELNAKLARSPAPKTYLELAQLYMEAGDLDAVHGVCEECVERFPDEDGGYLLLARAKLTSFYRDLSARDGIEAVRALQRVVELDPDNARAHKLLAEVLYRVGAHGMCREHLELLADLTPTDVEVEAMLQAIRSGGATRDAESEDVDVLFHDVESRGALPVSAVTRESSRRRVRPRSEDGVAGVREALAHLAEMAGVRKAAYIRGSKALVKGEIKDGKDSFLRVARVVVKAAHRASRRMDVGNFSKGVVDIESGNICLCSYGDVVAAVLCDHGTSVDRVLAELQELVAGSLCASARRSS
jgi:tetratricopeptide (TPR) repeat protein